MAIAVVAMYMIGGQSIEETEIVETVTGMNVRPALGQETITERRTGDEVIATIPTGENEITVEREIVVHVHRDVECMRLRDMVHCIFIVTNTSICGVLPLFSAFLGRSHK